MSVYEAAKDALRVAQKADNIELIQKIMNVQKEALDMQDKMSEKNELIEKLKRENNELKTRNTTDQQITYARSGAVILNNESYCAGCYGNSGKLVHLSRANDTFSNCPSCKAAYNVRGDFT